MAETTIGELLVLPSEIMLANMERPRPKRVQLRKAFRKYPFPFKKS